jgi:hypothetical protein
MLYNALRNKFIGIILLFLWIVKFKFVVLKINNHMSQEELLVLIYKKDESIYTSIRYVF